MPARRLDHDLMRRLGKKMSPAAVARKVKCAPGYARLVITGQVGSHDEGISRKAPRALMGHRSSPMPPIDHPAVLNARTIYPTTVTEVEGFRHAVLKSGYNSAKIGKRITKGRWKGFDIYTLTLEERATCPSSCHHWRSCYGNGMGQAHRLVHGPALESRLIEEVAALALRHPKGFAIRLHVLGDFYSVRYVELWQMLLEQFPQLHVFGFSARWSYHSDPIAKALVDLVMARWDRFAIRFSNAPIDECSTASIEHPRQIPADAVACPQQLGKTTACATCALCWQSKKRVAFIQH